MGRQNPSCQVNGMQAWPWIWARCVEEKINTGRSAAPLFIPELEDGSCPSSVSCSLSLPLEWLSEPDDSLAVIYSHSLCPSYDIYGTKVCLSPSSPTLSLTLSISPIVTHGSLQNFLSMAFIKAAY